MNWAAMPLASATAPVPFRNAALGVSLTAPPNWVLHQRSDDSPKSEVIHMLDAEAQAHYIALRIRASDSLSAIARNNARAWAEADISDHVTKDYKDFKLRAESWKTRTVSGHAGPLASPLAVENGTCHSDSFFPGSVLE